MPCATALEQCPQSDAGESHCVMNDKESIDPREASTGDKSEITRDLACIECKYNLRSLHVDGRCPECGTSIDASVHPDLNEIRNPWMRILTHVCDNALALYSPGVVFVLLIGIAGPNIVVFFIF